MKQVTTYVGIDAHKRDLFIAMLVGTHAAPVTWTVASEPQAVRRLVRKLERQGVVSAQLIAMERGKEFPHYSRRVRKVSV
jgi:hypothetical protein